MRESRLVGRKALHLERRSRANDKRTKSAHSPPNNGSKLPRLRRPAGPDVKDKMYRNFNFDSIANQSFLAVGESNGSEPHESKTNAKHWLARITFPSDDSWTQGPFNVFLMRSSVASSTHSPSRVSALVENSRALIRMQVGLCPGLQRAICDGPPRSRPAQHLAAGGGPKLNSWRDHLRRLRICIQR